MTEPIIAAGEQAIAEAAYQFVSTEIAHIEQTLPDRLNAAEQTVQDWGHDAVNALHRISAFIDQHRSAPTAASAQTPTAAPQQPTAPAAAATTQTPAATK